MFRGKNVAPSPSPKQSSYIWTLGDTAPTAKATVFSEDGTMDYEAVTREDFSKFTEAQKKEYRDWKSGKMMGILKVVTTAPGKKKPVKRRF